MAAWLKIQLAHGALPDGKRLFSEKQAAEMWAPVTPMPITPLPDALKPAQPTQQAYALGWQVQDYRGHRIVQHGGGVFGSIRERSTGRFLAGVRALSAIRSALLLPLQERLKPLLQGRGWRFAGGSGVREFVLRRGRVEVPALLAGPVFARSVEAFEPRARKSVV